MGFSVMFADSDEYKAINIIYIMYDQANGSNKKIFRQCAAISMENNKI